MVALFSKSSSFKLRKFQPYGKIKRGIVPHQWRVGWQSVVRSAGHDSPTLSGVEGLPPTSAFAFVTCPQQTLSP